jgi:hypothetical protein
MPAMPRKVFVAMVLLGLVIPSDSLGVTTIFGSDLTATPNVTFGCETMPQLSYQNLGFYELVPSGQPSCTWRQLGVFGVVADTHASTVPGDGTITSVSIKSGANPAPLRVTVVRLLAPNENGGINSNKAACCYFVRESPTFQPTANATSTFALNLPVEKNDTGGQVYTQDHVGISAQSGTGALPLAEVGQHSSFAFTQPGSFDANFTYSAMGAQAGDTQGGRAEQGVAGFEVLARFTWCSGTATAARTAQTCGGEGTNSGGATAPAKLGTTRLRARNGKVGLSIRCLLVSTCSGRVTLRTNGRRPRTVGSASVSVRAGSAKTVSVPLNAAGLSLAARRGTTALQALIDLGRSGKLTTAVSLRGSG